jgi:glycerol kinase
VAHIARAALESIAFQSTALLNAMVKDAVSPITELRVDGGAAANNLLLQFQADLLGIPVIRPQVTETTALGAAYLAGVATGSIVTCRSCLHSGAWSAPSSRTSRASRRRNAFMPGRRPSARSARLDRESGRRSAAPPGCISLACRC